MYWIAMGALILHWLRKQGSTAEWLAYAARTKVILALEAALEIDELTLAQCTKKFHQCVQTL